MTDLIDLTDWRVLAAAGVLALLAAGALGRLVQKGYLGQLLGALTGAIALYFSAEGMWRVVTETLKMPPEVAIGAFAVGESMMVTSAYIATSELHKLVKDAFDTPRARMLAQRKADRAVTAVWIIAGCNGALVSAHGSSPLEHALRFAVPLGAAYVWWITLPTVWREHATAIDKLLIRWGLKDSEEITITDAQRARRIDRMVAAACRYHRATGWYRTPLRAVHGRRAEIHARYADADMEAAAVERVRRSYRFLECTAPGAVDTKVDQRPDERVEEPVDEPDERVEEPTPEPRPRVRRQRSWRRPRLASAPVSPAAPDQLARWMQTYSRELDAVRDEATGIKGWQTREEPVTITEVRAAIAAGYVRGTCRDISGQGTLINIRACVEALSHRTPISTGGR